MSNNKPQSAGDDDILEDSDLDVGTEDENDLADDAWDDFDDDEAVQDSETEDKPVKNKTGTKGKKSPIGLIIVAVAVIGGGLYFVTSMGKAPLSSSPSGEQEQAAAGTTPVELAGTDQPPMPTPIESTSNENTPGRTTDISETTGAPLVAPVPDTSSQDALTPLPGSAEIPEPAPEAITAQANTPEQEPAAVAPAPEFAVEEALPAPVAEQPAVAAQPLAPIAPEQAVPLEDPAATARIQELEQEVATLKASLESQKSAADEKVSSLTATVEDLQEKLDKASEEISRKAEMTSPEVTAPEDKPALEKPPEQQASVARAPESVDNAAAEQSAPAPAAISVSSAHRWVLRSAQPGKAVLSPKGSNELRNIAVGDTLEGLGRITFIDLENGQWVVRGMQGQVVR